MLFSSPLVSPWPPEISWWLIADQPPSSSCWLPAVSHIFGPETYICKIFVYTLFYYIYYMYMDSLCFNFLTFYKIVSSNSFLVAYIQIPKRPSKCFQMPHNLHLMLSYWWNLAECRASGCQCQCRNCPRFDPSILRNSGIWGAPDEAVLNNVHKKRKKIEKNPPPFLCFVTQNPHVKTMVCRLFPLINIFILSL